MKRPLSFTIAALLLCIQMLSAQEAESTSVIKPKIKVYDYSAMPKDPLASMFFSATIPGSGQLYNKEYLRGIFTGIGFYGGLFTSEYLLQKWVKINTDTVYFEEYDKEGRPTGLNRAVFIMRDPNKQVGLPAAEKIALGSAAAIGVASYIFGLYDSYRGAKRFNRKLVASAPVTPSLYYSLGTTISEAGIRLNF
jgi:hypothetical protein